MTNSPDLSVSKVLGKENMLRFKESLKNMPILSVNCDEPTKRAAVLVPLCTVNNELSLLYTLRSSDLKDYAGHVSFPGGMQDESDSSLEETALRETYEEIGIERNNISIIGHGNFVASRNNDILVMPYVGFLGEVDVGSLKINRSEVNLVFTVTLNDLCDPKNFDLMKVKSGLTLPVFLKDTHYIWGLTAIITHVMLRSLLPNDYNHEIYIFGSKSKL